MTIKNLPEVISGSFVVLDSLQVNIFIADMDLKLVYMNPRAEKILRAFENEIFRNFGVRVDNILGESIHRFHKDPVRVSGILGNPLTLPHEAYFDFGEIHLKAVVNGIKTRDGEIIGYIVNWEDKSENVNKTEEMVSLVTELERIELKSNNF